MKVRYKRPMDKNSIRMQGDNWLVCYLDILGYTDLVKYDMPEKVLDRLRQSYDRFHRLSGEFNITLQSLSDSFIIAIDLGKKEDAPLKEARKVIDHLSIVAWWCTEIITQLGYFLRGGISIGKYFQDDLGDLRNQFIYSSALNDAHELAEEKADFPRVLIHENVYDRLQRSFPIKEWKLFKDFDDLICLDIYGASFLSGSDLDYSFFIMKKLKEECWERQVLKNACDAKVLRKYSLFSDYHNQKVRETNWGSRSAAEIESLILKMPSGL